MITCPVIQDKPNAGLPDLVFLLSVCLCITWQNVRRQRSCWSESKQAVFFHTDTEVDWTLSGSSDIMWTVYLNVSATS